MKINSMVMLVFVSIVILGGCNRHYPSSNENVLVNPGFDKTWDEEWIVDTFAYTDGCAGTEIIVKAEEGRSSPNCCYLMTFCEIACESGNQSSASAKARIYQNFDEIEGCKFKAYVKYDVSEIERAKCNVQLCINGIWKVVWELVADTSESVWTEISCSVDSTVTGIKFCAECKTIYSIGMDQGECKSWIDDVCVEPL